MSPWPTASPVIETRKAAERIGVRGFPQRPCDSTAFYVGQVLVKDSDFKSAGTKEPERSFAIVGHGSMVAMAVQQESETVRDRLIVVRLRSVSKPTSYKHGIRRRTACVAI
jgi:hypothetical protein